MIKNPNKTICVNARGIIICHGDKRKNHWVAYEEQSPLKRLQTMGQSHKGRRYQDEEKELTPTQNKMLRVALYGISQLSQKELKHMTLTEKLKITEVHEKAQAVIHRWKQEIVNETVDRFLLALFPKSALVKQMAEMTGVEDEERNQISLKELGVTKSMIVDKLIKEGIFPANFYEVAA